MAFFLISALIFLSDQAIKYLVHFNMFPNQSIPIINNILCLTYVQNKGAAFGIFWGKNSFLLIVGALVIVAILHFHRQIKVHDKLQVPLAFLLGGSLGNMFDRVFRSYVVDYIDFRVWPVFNLADIMINVGVVLIMFCLFIEKETI